MKKNNKKAGLLIIILAVPAFVVLIGSFFKGEHKFELPYVNDKSLPAITLQGVDSKEYTLGVDSSTFYVIAFHCKEEQKATNKVLSELTKVQEVFHNTSEPLQLFSVFICQENDTFLNEINKLYSVEERLWKVTKPKDGIKAMVDAFGVQLDIDHENYSEEAYTAIFLVDKQMKVRGFYNGISADDINKLIEDIKVLIHEYK